MYIGALVLTILMALSSALGALFVPWFLTADSDGGHSGILYVVGLMATAPAVVFGIIAFALLHWLRSNDQHRGRWLVRRCWVPLCPPVLVIIALHVMLSFK